MDIYEYAESIDWMADYYCMQDGYIYKIQEAGERIKAGEKNVEIGVVDSMTGEFIGYAKRKN